MRAVCRRSQLLDQIIAENNKRANRRFREKSLFPFRCPPRKGRGLPTVTCCTFTNFLAHRANGKGYQFGLRPPCADFHRTKETAAQEIPP